MVVGCLTLARHLASCTLGVFDLLGMRATLSAQGRGLARSRPVVGVNLPKARRAGVVLCAARKNVDANRAELEKAAREKAVALLAGLAATAMVSQPSLSVQKASRLD